jgi:hypothetical protein
LTVNELRHLFNVLIIEPSRRHGDPLLWSIYADAVTKPKP